MDTYGLGNYVNWYSISSLAPSEVITIEVSVTAVALSTGCIFLVLPPLCIIESNSSILDFDDESVSVIVFLILPFFYKW